MSTIGFVGLGAMGSRITGRLLGAGKVIYGTNRTKSRAQPLIERGLQWRESPRDVAATADVVFSTVTDDAALDAITSGPEIGSPMLKARVPLLLDLPEQAWFDVAMMQKDIRLALDAADESAIPLPSAAVADEMLTKASELGYAHRDLAALHAVLAKSPVA
jgi:3-hydroxyisobutyrate dehydrogenase-like beta-hydroxyacid dehydrogenase